jgi:hypothetical protein
MIFDTDYWNALNKKEKETVTINPKQLGYSLGGDPLKNLRAGIGVGAGNIELTFYNAPGKSSRSQGKPSRSNWKNRKARIKGTCKSK